MFSSLDALGSEKHLVGIMSPTSRMTLECQLTSTVVRHRQPGMDLPVRACKELPGVARAELPKGPSGRPGMREPLGREPSGSLTRVPHTPECPFSIIRGENLPHEKELSDLTHPISVDLGGVRISGGN